jgi:hypothetical protein
VGRRKAEAIVALRGRAPFQRVEDVLAVKGVSAAWLDRQRSHVTVGSAAPAAGRSATTAGARSATTPQPRAGSPERGKK